MTTPSNVPPMHRFTVTQTNLSGDIGNYHLTAAYFVEDGAYTLFKDSGHAVVEAFRTDTVLRISRGTAHDVSA